MSDDTIFVEVIVPDDRAVTIDVVIELPAPAPGPSARH